MDIKLKEVHRSGTGRGIQVTFDLYNGASSMGASIIVNKDTVHLTTEDSWTFTLEEIDMIAFQMRRIKEKIHYYGESFKL